MMFARSLLGVVPRVQLVSNNGITVSDATHTGGYNYYAPRFAKAGSLEFPLVHPAEVVCDEWAESSSVICLFCLGCNRCWRLNLSLFSVEGPVG